MSTTTTKGRKKDKWANTRTGSLQWATPSGDWFISMTPKGFATKYISFIENMVGTVNLPIETTVEVAKRAAEECEKNGGNK